jgi:hypothetical protein
MRRNLTATTVLLMLLISSRAFAQLGVMETENLRLIYLKPIHSYLTPHVARCFENSMRMQTKLFDFRSDEQVTVILSDFSDYGNAGAGVIPRNGLAVSIAPMSFAYETYPSNERMNTLMNHELVHIVNFDKATSTDRFFRSLFRGKVKETSQHPESVLYSYLTAPRSSAPRWYHEGIAVFVETWMAGGLGRAQGSYDEMVFRSMVRDGTRFYDPLGLVSEGTKIDFQVEMNSYLYGTRFMSYLARTTSPARLMEWVTRHEGTKGSYSAQFQHVFGRSLDDVWDEWIEWEKSFQEKNLERIREYPITPLTDISTRGLGSISRAFVDSDAREIYAALNYPGVVAHVSAIDLDTGNMRRIVDVKGPMMYSVTSMTYDPAARTIYYTTDNSEFRDLMSLDPNTGETRKVLEDTRIGDLAFNRVDRSIWGVRHNDGLSTLVRIPHPYTQWKRVFSLPYGEDMYDLDLSPDGKLLSASYSSVNGSSDVRIIAVSDLLEGSRDPVARFDFGSTIPSNFVFSEDGEYIYGSSYYTGVSNIFRYNVEADSVEAVSNTETGIFRPVPLADGSLVVFRYSGEGFIPATMHPELLGDINAITFLGAEIRKSNPELAGWNAGSPAAVNLDSLVLRDDDYSPLASVELESVIPVVEGYKDFPAYGLAWGFSDPLSLHRFNVTSTWSPHSTLDSDERAHISFDYRRYDWSLGAKWNDADFYDLFGPTRTSRKGYSAYLAYKKTLIYDMPRELDLTFNVAGYGGLETLPDYQNVAASFDKFFTGSVELHYTNVRFSLGAVDYEKGVTGTLALSDYEVNGTSFPSLRGDLDLGIPLFAHSSIWLRNSAGYSAGDHDESFANFYFGGFGNNWIDYRDSKRYRQWYAFPGEELNAVDGTNYLRSTVDWNLPPLRFRKLGLPSFYASWARTSLFASGLVANMDAEAPRRELMSVGAQVDLRMTLLNHRELTLSGGYAVSLESGRQSRDEAMISLKLF